MCSYTYDAWGRPLGVTGSAAATIGTKNPLRYRGYFYDEETGWYYLNSRHYDPETRRMLSADTEEVLLQDNKNLSDKNLFTYCDNNPITRRDDGGQLWAEAALVIGVGTISGGVLGAFSAAATGGDIINGIAEGAVNGAIGAVGAVIGTKRAAAFAGLLSVGVDIYAQMLDPSNDGTVDLYRAVKTGVETFACSSLKTVGGKKVTESMHAAIGSSIAWTGASVRLACKNIVQSFINKTPKIKTTYFHDKVKNTKSKPSISIYTRAYRFRSQRR